MEHHQTIVVIAHVWLAMDIYIINAYLVEMAAFMIHMSILIHVNKLVLMVIGEIQFIIDVSSKKILNNLNNF